MEIEKLLKTTKLCNLAVILYLNEEIK